MKRQIITIDESRCTGCGACVPDCPEGALQIIDGKARLISDLFCDGLGACIGACPENAIDVEFRDADPYDERRVMLENIIPKGVNTIKAHLSHMKSHGADEYLSQALEVLKEWDSTLYSEMSSQFGKQPESCPASGCPGSLARSFDEPDTYPDRDVPASGSLPSELKSWPIQMHLVNPSSQHFLKSDFLLAADCTAFSMGAFHPEMIRNHTVGIACPKLDSGLDVYRQKLVKLISEAKINTLTIAVMEVPCCNGLVHLAVDAVKTAKRKVPVKYIQISIKGEILQEKWLDV